MRIEVENINLEMHRASSVAHEELDYEHELERDEHLQFLTEHLPFDLDLARGSLHEFQIDSSRVVIWNFSLYPLRVDQYGFLYAAEKYFKQESNEIGDCHMLLRFLSSAGNPILECWVKKDGSREIEKSFYRCTGALWEKISEPPCIVSEFYGEFSPER